MVRQVMSYALTAIMLLSQTGLPLHMHYCKGMLESVSVVFSRGCDDHDEVATLDACCKKEETTSCDKNNGDCCDDKVSILIQEITSLIPHFDKWDFLIPEAKSTFSPATESAKEVSIICLPGIHTDSGPPIYIRYQSLIFYG
jgi:hypothetical protein